MTFVGHLLNSFKPMNVFWSVLIRCRFLPLVGMIHCTNYVEPVQKVQQCVCSHDINIRTEETHHFMFKWQYNYTAK